MDVCTRLPNLLLREPKNQGWMSTFAGPSVPRSCSQEGVLATPLVLCVIITAVIVAIIVGLKFISPTFDSDGFVNLAVCN